MNIASRRPIIMYCIAIFTFFTGEVAANPLKTTLLNGTIVNIDYNYFSSDRALQKGKALAQAMFDAACKEQRDGKSCSPEIGYYTIDIFIGESSVGKYMCLSTLNGRKSSFLGTKAESYIEVVHFRCSGEQSFYVEDFN